MPCAYLQSLLGPDLTEVAHIACQLCAGVVLLHWGSVDTHIFCACRGKGFRDSLQGGVT